MKYKLLKCGVHSIGSLEQEVNKYIDEGWKPVGPIQVITIDKQTVIIQQIECMDKEIKNG